MKTLKPFFDRYFSENYEKQIDLAKRLGINQGTLSKWIKGKETPTSNYDKSFLKVFGHPIFELLEESHEISETENIGKIISDLRKQKRMNQKDFAEKCDISYTLLRSIEKGIEKIPNSLIKKINDVLSVDLKEHAKSQIIQLNDHSNISDSTNTHVDNSKNFETKECKDCKLKDEKIKTLECEIAQLKKKMELLHKDMKIKMLKAQNEAYKTILKNDKK